jgi:hypothetical protein
MGNMFKNLLLKPVSQFKANMAWMVLILADWFQRRRF